MIMLFMNFGEYSCRYTNPTYPLIRSKPLNWGGLTDAEKKMAE